MAKITITKGRNYDLTIIVKQPGSLNPLELSATATAIFYIIDKDSNEQLIAKDMERVGMPEDGKFLLKLDETETASLPSVYELPEDGSIAMDTCRGHMAITDLDNVLQNLHHIDVQIPQIFVADIGV